MKMLEQLRPIQEGVALTEEGAEPVGTWAQPGGVHTSKDWASRVNKTSNNVTSVLSTPQSYSCECMYIVL